MSTVNPLDGIELDPGDMGLVFVPGVGFRPVDGVDAYGNGKAACDLVFHSNEPGGQWEHIVHVCDDGPALWTEKWEWIPPNDLAPPTYSGFAPTSPLYPAPTPVYWTPTPWTPTTWCCTTTTIIPAPDPDPMPAVDLPATGLLLATALIGATIIRAAQTFRLAAAIKDQI